MLLSKVVIQFNLFCLILSCTLVHHKDMTVNSFEDEPLEYASKRALLLGKKKKKKCPIFIKSSQAISHENVVYSGNVCIMCTYQASNGPGPVLSP